MPVKALDPAELIMPKQVSEIDTLKEELALFRKMLLGQEKQPDAVTNDVRKELEKPRRIQFTINAVQDDDAFMGDAWIPGRAVVSLFRFTDALKSNQYGTRYTTGFEYDELEFNSPFTGEELASYINDVRIARQWIERYYPANLSADNVQFWQNRVLRIESFDQIYDTKDNLDNLILYYNIMGGGYTTIARNYDDAKNNRELKNQRLYMSVQELEQERKFNARGTYIEANAMLSDILKNWSSTDALYLLHYLPYKKFTAGYHAGTPMQQFINQFADFIDGVDTKNEKKKRPQMFIDAVTMFKTNSGVIKTTAVFKAAQYYGFITFNKAENTYTNRATGFNYGNTEKGAVDSLLNPKHIDELSWIKAKVNDKWIK